MSTKKARKTTLNAMDREQNVKDVKKADTPAEDEQADFGGMDTSNFKRNLGCGG